MARGWEEVLKDLSSGTKPETIKEFTCYKCEDNKTCEFSFDLYNLNGDCLASK